VTPDSWRLKWWLVSVIHRAAVSPDIVRVVGDLGSSRLVVRVGILDILVVVIVISSIVRGRWWW